MVVDLFIVHWDIVHWLADLMRWLLHLPSTDALIRHLEEWGHLAGAVNFTSGEIPDESTFSRRRRLLPIDDLMAILHTSPQPRERPPRRVLWLSRQRRRPPTGL
jgi:hypothetical protein